MIPQSSMILKILSWWILVLTLLSGTEANSAKRVSSQVSSPRSLLKQAQQQQNFHWDAGVDSNTGLASSTETSSFGLQKSNLKATPPLSKHHVQSISQHIVSTWPTFICKPSVSLGLFCASKKSDDDVMCIHPILFPSLRLLDFGRPKPGPQHKQHPNDVLCGSWEIPIRGGLLALPSGYNGQGYHGKLTFSIAEQRHANCNGSMYQLTTHIVKYSPTLAGPPPVQRIRKQVYLHSQSLVHAYVTWRFHKVWKQELLQYAK